MGRDINYGGVMPEFAGYHIERLCRCEDDF